MDDCAESWIEDLESLGLDVEAVGDFEGQLIFLVVVTRFLFFFS